MPSRFLAILAALCLTFGISYAWWIQHTEVTSPSAQPVQTVPALKIAGSNTLFPAFTALGAAYEVDRKIRIINSNDGSSAGIKMLLDGEADIARSSRDLKPNELENARANGKTLQVYIIGFGAMGIVVHPSKQAALTGITRDQTKRLFFSGDLRDWRELSPQLTGKIKIAIRDVNTSGSAVEFAEMVTGDSKTAYATDAEIHDYDGIIAAILADPNTIGYLSLGYMDDRTYTLPFANENGEFIPASVDTIQNRQYPLNRNLYVVTDTHANNRVLDFMEFAMSPAATDILLSKGVVPAR